jgi:hypothetical protein
MPINVLMIAQTNPGKAGRYEELFGPWIADLKKYEPEVSVFHISGTEDYEEGTKTYLMHMALVSL